MSKTSPLPLKGRHSWSTLPTPDALWCIWPRHGHTARRTEDRVTRLRAERPMAQGEMNLARSRGHMATDRARCMPGPSTGSAAGAEWTGRNKWHLDLVGLDLALGKRLLCSNRLREREQWGLHAPRRTALLRKPSAPPPLLFPLPSLMIASFQNGAGPWKEQGGAKEQTRGAHIWPIRSPRGNGNRTV